MDGHDPDFAGVRHKIASVSSPSDHIDVATHYRVSIDPPVQNTVQTCHTRH